MKDFREAWLEIAREKKTLLCVGIDASEPGQRSKQSLREDQDKVEWTLDIIDRVAPYAAAIKINRNYYKDISRADMQRITRRIREKRMLSIDDTKLADIGDTNAAAIFHASEEGYDSLTYAPFPGNTRETAREAKKQGVGLIQLVLMSNPEFGVMKNASIQGRPFFEFLADEAIAADVEGVVIGAPSEGNHISFQELDLLKAKLTKPLILVPGIGAQGGDIRPIVQRFGMRAMINVGRSIIYAEDPALAAKGYRDQIMAEIAEF